MKKPDINGFLKDLLEGYANGDWQDIDGGDMHAWLERHGLTYERPITEEEAQEEWAQEWDMKPGDLHSFMHPEIKALIGW